MSKPKSFLRTHAFMADRGPLTTKEMLILEQMFSGVEVVKYTPNKRDEKIK